MSSSRLIHSSSLPLSGVVFMTLETSRAMCDTTRSKHWTPSSTPSCSFTSHTDGTRTKRLLLELTFGSVNLLQNKQKGKIIYLPSNACFPLKTKGFFLFLFHKCKVGLCKLGEQNSVHTNDLQICYIFLRRTAGVKGYLKRYRGRRCVKMLGKTSLKSL